MCKAGGLLLADDCQEGYYVSPWGDNGRNFTQGALFDAYADYVLARPASLASALCVRKCKASKLFVPVFCMATKGRPPERVSRTLEQILRGA